ncbi:cytosol aminopeptidase [uncultured archaeon]|nr:cytosol aminopeptidase [uncultured archaeon]
MIEIKISKQDCNTKAFVYSKSDQNPFDSKTNAIISDLRKRKLKSFKDLSNYFVEVQNNFDSFRNAGGLLNSLMESNKQSEAKLVFSKSLNETAVIQFAEGMVLASYRFDKYKEERDFKVSKVFFDVNPSYSDSLRKSIALCECQNISRDFSNEPSNILYPEAFVQKALTETKGTGLKVSFMNEKELEKKGFGALLAVGMGSSHKPRLLVLEYNGGGKEKIALVGKGITFDTGGISIKPANDMDKMKHDKSGASAVVGAIIALSKLKVKAHVYGVCALAENMPSGESYRPGDIVKTYSGKFIEVLNTDAEGRVVLSDALWYASNDLKADYVIDAATLTGACVVALGDVCAGFFTNDEKLRKTLLDSGNETGERLWELPLWEEYDEKVKSDFTSGKNIGEPGNAGVNSGASFLKKFISEKTKWAHLDIAGTAYYYKPKPYYSKGASGFATKLFVKTVESLEKS